MNEPVQATPPPLRSSTDQRLWSVLCHASFFFGLPLIFPFIVYLVKKNEDPLVAANAASALNFHLSYLIWSVACIPLVFLFIGIPLIFAVVVAEFVLAIVGTIKASEDKVYQYPLTVPFFG